MHLHSQISKTGGQLSGPNGAVEAVCFWKEGGDSRKWTREELEKNLEVVWEMVIDPKSPVEEIRRYQELARRVQGRELSVADLEHMLCKISRQMPKGVGRENKKRREGQKKKKRGKRDKDEDQDVLEEGDEKISVWKKTVKKAKEMLV